MKAIIPGISMENISVIIPTFNEAGNIGRLVSYLKSADSRYLLEIIVVDGGSDDITRKEARDAGALVVLSEKGRAVQMNTGAKRAKGSILYFLHSDTFPPKHYDEMIVETIRKGHSWGTFRLRFDHRHWFLLFITSVVNLNFIFFRFGDQSLFVKRGLFSAIGRFDSSQIVFEDTEMARRLRAYARGRIIRIPVITSARKFRENGVYKMTLIFVYIWILYLLRFSHHRILTTYKKLIIQNKI